jgi:hypothetical protein
MGEEPAMNARRGPREGESRDQNKWRRRQKRQHDAKRAQRKRQNAEAEPEGALQHVGLDVSNCDFGRCPSSLVTRLIISRPPVPAQVETGGPLRRKDLVARERSPK